MAAYTKFIPRFLTMRNSRNGLAGYMQQILNGVGIAGSGTQGSITIASGTTSIVVSDTGYAAGDKIEVSIQGKPTNVCYYTGYSAAVAGTGYTLNVNTDPGSGGVVLFFRRLPAAMFFAS